MGWNHPNPIYYDNCKYDDPWGPLELVLMLGLIWIFLGFVPSLFIALMFFPPEKVGLLIPFIIWVIGLIIFIFLYFLLDLKELKKISKQKRKHKK